MQILLTGGSGFVGLSFIKSLGIHDEVVCLGRDRFTEDGSNLKFLKVDITNKQELQAAADRLSNYNFDAIIHMAAYVPRTAQSDNLQMANDVNIQGTINLLEVFHGRFKKLIIGSTAEVYDQSRLTAAVNESTILGPSSYYGVTKLSSEFIALAYGKKEKITVTVLRFSVMYGPNDPIVRALPNFIKKALNNETIEIIGGQVKRDYTHVDDVVSSIYCALKSNFHGVLNIGTGRAVSIEEAARMIVEAAKSSSEVVVLKGASGADILIDPIEADQAIKYSAKIIFPEGIKEMIESFR